jgi:hypothetical protein
MARYGYLGRDLTLDARLRVNMWKKREGFLKSLAARMRT